MFKGGFLISLSLAAMLMVLPDKFVARAHAEYFFVTGHDTLNIHGEWLDLDYVYALDSSTVNVSDSFVSYLYTSETSTANLFNWGTVDDLTCSDSSVVNISDNASAEVYMRDSSTVNVSGGIAWVQVYDTCTAYISGGEKHRFWSWNSGRIDISGGSITLVTPIDDSVVTISGGSVDLINAEGESTTFISGGLLGRLQSFQSSTVVFQGKDFQLGEGLTLEGSRILGRGTLSGQWTDGTNWSVAITGHDPGATILIPEPITLSLLTVGCWILAGRRVRL